MSKTRNHIDDLRGATQLAVDATRGVAELVQAMQLGITGGTAVIGEPLERVTRALGAPVYGGIRAVTGLVGRGIDAALTQLAPLVGERVPRPEHEAVVAVLNGVLGDYLEATGNPLATPMQLRVAGAPSEPVPTRRLLVLVHGSCMNDRQWLRNGHDHGVALARDLGVFPVWLRYNTGRHISTNGRELADVIEAWVIASGAVPESIAIVAHSMGGLVTRSACHYAEQAGHTWRSALRSIVCLGSPHHGAPLERGGNWFEVLLGLTRYSAPLARLGKIRSAGVTDMRFGTVLDEDWQGRDRFEPGVDARTPLPLPADVDCFTIAATIRATPPDPPSTKLPGDGIVPVASALGEAARRDLSLAFAATHRWIAHGTTHLGLLDDPQVYARIRAWIERSQGGSAS